MSEMVNMAPPWQGMTREEISRAVATGRRPTIAFEHAANTPTAWIELMEQCWHQDPKNRPSFDLIHDTLQQAGITVEYDDASVSHRDTQDVEMEMYYSLVPTPTDNDL